MKRIVSFILALAIGLSLCACGGNRNAYNLSSEVFTDIQKAYEKIDRIGDDILAAWTLGVYNEDSLKRSHTAQFADALPVFGRRGK